MESNKPLPEFEDIKKFCQYLRPAFQKIAQRSQPLKVLEVQKVACFRKPESRKNTGDGDTKDEGKVISNSYGDSRVVALRKWRI